MDDPGTIESIDVAVAERCLETLLDRVERGERICLTRDGQPVAWLTAIVERPRSPRAQHEELTASMPYQAESAGDFLRRLRDEDRY